MTEYPKLLTIGEVAARLAMPRWTLAYLIEKGVVPGPHLTVPGRRLFSMEDLERIREALRRREERKLQNKSRSRQP